MFKRTHDDARREVEISVDGQRVLAREGDTVSAALLASGLDARRALAFNWESRVGFLAIGELDGVPYLQLCENRPYACMDAAEVDRLVLEIGGTGDEMERRMSAGGDLL